MKVKLLLNLENFQNITFVSNNDKDRLDAYEELLPCVEDWVGYTPYALKLANRIRKILSLDPYEVENEEQFNKEKIVVTEEVETNTNTQDKNMDIKVLYIDTYPSGKAYQLKWVGHKGDIALPKSLVDAMNKDFDFDPEVVQTIRVPKNIMEDKK